jgi:hypothetical protein
MDHVRHGNEMTGVGLGEPVDEVVTSRIRVKAVDAPVALEEIVGAQLVEDRSSFRFGYVEPLSGCPGRPTFVGILPQEEQRFKLGDRLDMLLDELSQVVGN